MDTFMRPAQTIRMSDHVHVTKYALYGTIYKPYIQRRIKLAQLALDYFKKNMNLYSRQEIVIKPGKFSKDNAYFCLKDVFIYVKPSLTPYSFVLAIAHECVHAEQFKRGDLSLRVNMFGEAEAAWKGRLQDYRQVLQSHDKAAYRALPWEVEAFGRQSTLADSFMRNISRANYIELFYGQ